jgi:hypothetical protein
MIGTIPGLNVHWGLVFGSVAAVLAYILIFHTVFGFAARIAGGNVRAAKAVGLGVGRLILIACFLAGAAAGPAGMVEVAAVQGRTNANLASGYGFTGGLTEPLERGDGRRGSHREWSGGGANMTGHCASAQWEDLPAGSPEQVLTPGLFTRRCLQALRTLRAMGRGK